METTETHKSKQSNKSQLQTESIRVHKNTKKQIMSDLVKINKKEFGKKVKFEAYIKKAISKLNEHDFDELRQSSLTSADKIRVKYQEYCKKNGPISQDDFALLMMEERDQALKTMQQKKP